MGDYSSIDLDWTWDGDYTINEDGDLSDTSDDFLASIEHEIQTIIKSEHFDWQKEPSLGANLSDFVGEPNTRETGQAITNRVRSAILDAGIVHPSDLAIRVVPLNIYQVAILVSIAAVIHDGNRLTVSEPVVINTVFDSVENDIFFMPTSNVDSYG